MNNYLEACNDLFEMYMKALSHQQFDFAWEVLTTLAEWDYPQITP